MLRICLLTLVPVVLNIVVTDPPPTGDEYKYSYSVKDPTTGDLKSQHEIRHGDTVSGSYSVVDPDGTLRTVEYTAHPTTGFKAVVKLEPATTHTHYTHPRYVLRDPPPPAPVVEYTSIPARYSRTRPKVYFTPENEIQKQKNIVKGQHYFVPAN